MSIKHNESFKVSVIICCYTFERLNDIVEAIESVLTQTLTPLELIVAVDNNEELYQQLITLKFPNTRVILNTKARGFSQTKNLGILKSKGHIVAFLDDDAVAEKTWLEKLTKSFSPAKQIDYEFSSQKHVVATGGMTIPRWSQGAPPFWFPEELNWAVGGTYKGLPLHENQMRNVMGGNCAIRKDVFNKTGLFGTQFGRVGDTGVAEEAEFCLRLKTHFPHSIILFEADAVVYHKVSISRSSLNYLKKRAFDEGKSKGRLISFNQVKSPQLLTTENSYLQYLLFYAIPGRLKCFYRRDSLPKILAIIIAITATVIGYISGRIERSKIPK
ncbi:MAG TPA: glycosyltransferase [Dehalococcoidia bacterium]|nr:glycosyltransferase [Dehalococcoidia bacterium]